VIAVAVRWYLRYGLSYRDVEELLAERGIEVDHATVYRWVQTFTAEFIDAARPTRHSAGDRCFVDETYVEVTGRWTYLHRAVDQHGQVIDVFISPQRNAASARESSIALCVSGRRRSRSPRTVHRSTRASSRTSSPPPGTSPSSTPTTVWKPITAGSRRDCVRCADSND